MPPVEVGSGCGDGGGGSGVVSVGVLVGVSSGASGNVEDCVEVGVWVPVEVGFDPFCGGGPRGMVEVSSVENVLEDVHRIVSGPVDGPPGSLLDDPFPPLSLPIACA